VIHGSVALHEVHGWLRRQICGLQHLHADHGREAVLWGPRLQSWLPIPGRAWLLCERSWELRCGVGAADVSLSLKRLSGLGKPISERTSNSLQHERLLRCSCLRVCARVFLPGEFIARQTWPHQSWPQLEPDAAQ
jgi:hypothetical protein